MDYLKFQFLEAKEYLPPSLLFEYTTHTKEHLLDIARVSITKVKR